jgi:peptidoglycan/LPS O-acetylase OafA/YrhL
MGRRLWILLLLPIIAGPAILLLWSPDYMDATWNYGFVRCLYGFSLGALVYLACGQKLAAARSRPASATVWTLAEIMAVAAVFLFVSVSGKGPWSIAAPFLFAAALLVFARDAGLLSRALRTRIFLWLGGLSYGIYMVHIFVQARMINAASLLEKATGIAVTGEFTLAGETFHGFGVMGSAFGILMTGVMVIAVTATAWLGYVLIEKPFQRWSKRLGGRIGAARDASPASMKRNGTAGGLIRARRV